MTKYLITPSLLSSLNWYLKESFTRTEAEQRQEFLQTLRREKTPTTEAQAKGLKFEEDIKFYCDFGLKKAYGSEIFEVDPIVRFLGDMVKGGLWQQSVKKDLQIGNQSFLLYGRTDVIKRDTVFDIKFTNNYELGKFWDSAQHLIYLYCTGLPQFTYLISDGKDWWKESYVNDLATESRIKSKISDLLGYLENDAEAKEIFFTKWKSK